MSAGAAEQFNIHEAKTQLSKILERVEHGEEVVISRAGKPIAKVVPLRTSTRRRGRGSLRGTLAMAEDWDTRQTNESIAEDFGL
ncbi:type II toxin-antitoxin system Phd/YefM family antitoxin [Planobispora longispora]|nr:type II toxin-antitoxin system prevent-host-death family antitoxin [Planobispora longispora]